jgi:protein required for attachment to host cells
MPACDILELRGDKIISDVADCERLTLYRQSGFKLTPRPRSATSTAADARSGGVFAPRIRTIASLAPRTAEQPDPVFGKG